MAVREISIRAHVHATESLERVKKAIRNVAGIEDLKISSTKLYGHYGNEIIVLSVRSRETDLAKAIWMNILGGMDEDSKKSLMRTLKRRVDQRSLYVRLNKQGAYLGRISLDDRSDVIRVRVTFDRIDVKELSVALGREV